VLRRYTLQDIPTMLTHIGVFLNEAENYRGIPFDKEKLRMLLINNDRNNRFFCNLAVENDEIIGGLCAIVQEYTFSKAAFCADLLFYVDSNRRSLKAATELVESYVEWAKQRGVVECRLANSTGVKPEAYAKLCEKFGFSYLGPIYQMRF